MKAKLIILLAWFKATFTWPNIKTWPRRLFNWICKLLRGYYAGEIFCMILAILYAFQVSRFFGGMFFLIAVWFLIQRVYERHV